jgi:hypothetical protein
MDAAEVNDGVLTWPLRARQEIGHPRAEGVSLTLLKDRL